MVREVMLTTNDNPYDPFDNWDEWLMFDMVAGYNCCGLVDRVAVTSGQLTLRETNEEIESAIDRIIANDFQNVYKKVVREVPDSVLNQGLSEFDIEKANNS